MENNPWFRALIIFLAIIAGLYLWGLVWSTMMLFYDVIMLFFLSWLLAFILKPLANYLVTHYSLPRILAVGTIYLVLLLALVVAGIVVVPGITFQLSQLATLLPQSGDDLNNFSRSFQQALEARGLLPQVSEWYKSQDVPAQIQNVGKLIIQNTLPLLTGVASTLFNLLIVLILSFYITLDGEKIAEQLVELAPEPYRNEVRYLFSAIDHSFGGFLRGQLVLAVMYAIGMALVMWVAGLGYIMVATAFAAIIMLVPFFGPFLALVPPLLVAAFQLPLSGIVATLVALLILQQVVLNVVAPKVMGDALGMHPLLVFFAIFSGLKVAGLAGAIFGVPIAAVINTMILYFVHRGQYAEQTASDRTSQANTRGNPERASRTWYGGVIRRLGRLSKNSS